MADEEEAVLDSDMLLSEASDPDIDMDADGEDERRSDEEDAEVKVDDLEGPDAVEDADQDQDQDEPEDSKLDPEDEDDPGDISDLDELSSPPADSHSDQPRLKITLKLPAQNRSPSNAGSSTPALEDSTQPPSRRDDIDIESEDEDGNDEEFDGDRAGSTPSTSAAGRSGRLTARQAVLASMVDVSHVSLNETSRKKKQLNEAEIALRREETARKRKNLSEKKLEDEKAETINRLLKKQSRPKNKRNALSTAEDRPANSTPPNPAASEVGGGENEELVPEQGAAEIVPVMYHWVSTVRPSTSAAQVTTAGTFNENHNGDGPGGDTPKRMIITFSVPLNALPGSMGHGTDTNGEAETMHVDPSPPAKPICDFEGCTEVRKYRLVGDWTRGACGIGHLKLLQGNISVATS